VVNITPFRKKQESKHRHQSQQQHRNANSTSRIDNTTWTCSTCTLINEQRNRTCSACEAPRDQASVGVSRKRNGTSKVGVAKPRHQAEQRQSDSRPRTAQSRQQNSSQSSSRRGAGSRSRNRQHDRDNGPCNSKGSMTGDTSQVETNPSRQPVGRRVKGNEQQRKSNPCHTGEKPQKVCAHFLKGECRFGSQCRFVHTTGGQPTTNRRTTRKPNSQHSRKKHGKSQPNQ